jgi:hypothetical protein
MAPGHVFNLFNARDSADLSGKCPCGAESEKVWPANGIEIKPKRAAEGNDWDY